MVPRVVLERRRVEALTPYIAQAWDRHFTIADLHTKYPTFIHMLRSGFIAGIPPILATYSPINRSSIIDYHNDFLKVIESEFEKGRYIGPFSKHEITELLGPFQTSPLSIIPKPHKPGSFRLIQNFSHPHSRSGSVTSINKVILSENYPCTWGTFGTISLLIWFLPPGSEGATRDVKEAYRTVPLHSSQWPGMVVRLDEDNTFAIDTQNAFGLASGAGIYGLVADAGMDIMRAQGIGPITKWVDDHLFIRIRREYLVKYNSLRTKWAEKLDRNGGLKHSKGRLWLQGDFMDIGRFEEYDDDCTKPIKDHVPINLTRRNQHDIQFLYSFEDIDALSEELGIPWEKDKDVPFAPVATFIGFEWNIEERTVSLPLAKRKKYLLAIEEWERADTHTLDEAQKLHGKLIHATLIQPHGRPYLINLEAFLGIFRDSPFKPRTPSKALHHDLQWWRVALTADVVQRPIPGPITAIDIAAYSDASSGVGVAITIGNRWRAWRLVPGWKAENRDIGWAEAVGFYFLAATILACHSNSDHFKVYGDNQGIVEGWWKGRSRNKPTNEIFKRISELARNSQSSFYTRYVPSKLNPADDPSRGKYYNLALLLPAPPIPDYLRTFIVDFDHPLLPIEQQLTTEGKAPSPEPKPPYQNRDHTHPIFDYEAENFTRQNKSWQ